MKGKKTATSHNGQKEREADAGDASQAYGQAGPAPGIVDRVPFTAVVSCSYDLGMVEFCRDWLKWYFTEVETLSIGHHPTRGDSGILGQVINQCIMYQ